MICDCSDTKANFEVKLRTLRSTGSLDLDRCHSKILREDRCNMLQR